MSNILFGGKGETEFYDVSKDDFSKTAGQVSGESYENSPFAIGRRTGEGHRAGRVLEVRENFRHLFYGVGIYPDGVGTKTVPHTSMKRHFVAAHDIGAMTLDDAATQGDRATSFNSVLEARDVGEDSEFFIQMIRELGVIAKQQGVVLLAGETANMGPCVSTPDKLSGSAFNWAGFVTSVKHPLIHHPDGNKTNFGKLEPGNVVVALKQGGFRSNGISAVRRGFEAEFGPNYYSEAPRELLEDAFQASTIYARAVGEALGWDNNFPDTNVRADDFEFKVDIRGIAHLSGGSFEGKFREGLLHPHGVSAVLDNLYPTPDIVKRVFEWQQKVPERLGRNKSDVTTLNHVYQTFCAGQGMLVVVGNEAEADKLIKILGADNKIDAKIAGVITANTRSSNSQLEISGDHISLDQ